MRNGEISKMTQGMKLFYCYARADEKLRVHLEKHLAPLRHTGLISEWHDREILPGAVYAEEINARLSEADIILLLVSKNFFASKYCYSIEMKKALERHQAGEVCVVPIILSPVTLDGEPISELQMLPTDGKPITTWNLRDSALYDVAQGLRKIIADLQTKSRILGVQEILRTARAGQGLFVGTQIPRDKLATARKICQVPQEEQILALIDCTFTGSAENCLLFGTAELYYHHTSARPPQETLLYTNFQKCTFAQRSGGVETGTGLLLSLVGSNVSPRQLCDILNQIKQEWQYPFFRKVVSQPQLAESEVEGKGLAGIIRVAPASETLTSEADEEPSGYLSPQDDHSTNASLAIAKEPVSDDEPSADDMPLAGKVLPFPGVTLATRTMPMPATAQDSPPVTPTEERPATEAMQLLPPPLDEKFQESMHELNEGHIERALLLWEQILVVHPDYRNGTLKLQLQRLKDEYRPEKIRQLCKQLTAAQWAAAEHADWEEEIKLWEELLEWKPNDTQARDYLAIARKNQEYRPQYLEIQALVEQGKLTAARYLIKSLRGGAPYFGDPARIAPKLGLKEPPPYPIARREHVIKEKCGGRGFVGFCVFSLLSGFGASLAFLVHYWPLSVSAVLLTAAFTFIFGYRKACSLPWMIGLTLVSAALAFGVNEYASTLPYSQVQVDQFWILGNHTLWLGRQIDFGLALGLLGMGATIPLTLGFYEDESEKGKESEWSLIDSVGVGVCMVIIFLMLPGWLIGVAAAALFNWGFGFGFGWYFSLLTIVPIMLCGLGLAASLIIWQKMRTA